MLNKIFTNLSVLGMALVASITLTLASANAAIYTTTSKSAFSTLGGNSGVGSTTDSVNWSTFDDTLGQAHENGTIQNGAYMTTTSGEKITAISGDGNPFNTYVQGGPNWKGDFSTGVTILYTADGTITLSFAVPLIGIGIDAQILDAGPYNETLTAYSTLCTNIAQATATCKSAATGLLGSVINSGTSTGVSSSGSAGTVPFVGISTDAQNNASSLATNGISFITISAGPTNGDGFAIDTSLLYHYPILAQTAQTQTAPEPGTLGLLGVGLIGLGWARRRLRA